MSSALVPEGWAVLSGCAQLGGFSLWFQPDPLLAVGLTQTRPRTDSGQRRQQLCWGALCWGLCAGDGRGGRLAPPGNGFLVCAGPRLLTPHGEEPVPGQGRDLPSRRSEVRGARLER